jgi:hypothetical protein
MQEAPRKPARGTLQRVAQGLHRHSISGVYFAHVRIHGKLFRESLGVTDRKLANGKLAEFCANISRLGPKLVKMTIAELCDSCAENVGTSFSELDQSKNRDSSAAQIRVTRRQILSTQIDQSFPIVTADWLTITTPQPLPLQCLPAVTPRSVSLYTARWTRSAIILQLIKISETRASVATHTELGRVSHGETENYLPGSRGNFA